MKQIIRANVKGLFRSFNLLNILLILIIIMLLRYSILPMFRITVTIEYSPSLTKQTAEGKEEFYDESHIPSLSDYTMVADENLFHPERKIPVEKKEEKALPKPDFVLYGTLIADDLSFAYIEDLKAPRSSPGRGKRQTVLKKGDSMSGFVLKEIEVDKIVMAKGDETMMLYVRDPQRIKVREAISATHTVPTQPVSVKTEPRSSSPLQKIIERTNEPIVPPQDVKDIKDKDQKIFDIINRL